MKTKRFSNKKYNNNKNKTQKKKTQNLNPKKLKCPTIRSNYCKKGKEEKYA
jgi:hypothetical protein